MSLSRLKYLIAFLPASVYGYSYYFSDTLTSINASNWTQNGSLTASASGIYSTTENTSGSLILKSTVPGFTTYYEVKATLIWG